MSETLVFIPGTLCDARVFAPQLAHFETRYACEVVIPEGATTIEGMAQRALDRIKAPEFNLIGFSLGGILAMAMLKFASPRIKRLALLNTNHRADPPERKAQRTRFISLTRAGEFNAVLPYDIQAQFLGRAVPDKSALLNEILAMALAIGPATYIEQMMAARDRPDFSHMLRSYQGPTLILCGEDDSVTSPQRHHVIHRLVDHSTFLSLPHVGHYSTLEAPDSVNAALSDLLQRHKPIE